MLAARRSGAARDLRGQRADVRQELYVRRIGRGGRGTRARHRDVRGRERIEDLEQATTATGFFTDDDRAPGRLAHRIARGHAGHAPAAVPAARMFSATPVARLRAERRHRATLFIAHDEVRRIRVVGPQDHLVRMVGARFDAALHPRGQ